MRRPTQHSCVALLLAGQSRTLSESQVRRDLITSVVRPTRAVLFAHLSAEHEYDVWHNFSTSSEASADSLVDIIRAEFHPVAFLRVENDREVQRHPSWSGVLQRPQRFSVLFFRWLLLHKALANEETRRGSRFEIILRMRPDLIVSCSLPLDVGAWMRGYSALQHGDVMLIAQRDAAEVALHTYVHANASALCALKAELCVPGLLAAHNFSLATLTPGTVSVVRPAAFCIQPHLQARLPEWLSCGRAALGRAKLPCAAPTRSWNLTEHVKYWRDWRRSQRTSARRT